MTERTPIRRNDQLRRKGHRNDFQDNRHLSDSGARTRRGSNEGLIIYKMNKILVCPKVSVYAIGVTSVVRTNYRQDLTIGKPDLCV